MTLKALSAAAAAASILALGCTQQSDMDNGAPAADRDAGLGPGTVSAPDGHTIPESLFRYYALNALEKAPEELTTQERDAVIENLVNLDLLAEQAEERGLTEERTVAVELELRRQQVLAAAMINRIMEETQPSEAELQAEYEASLPELETVEHKARHILVESEEQANALIEELNAGADFAALADEHSLDAAGNGGDLDWFSTEGMVEVEPFARAVSEMEVGTFSSQPVETQFGWHVILVEDRRTNEPPELDDVREALSNRVAQQRVEAFIESLRESNSGSSDSQ